MREKMISLVLILILLGSICIPIYATSTSALNDQKSDIQDKITETEDEKNKIEGEINQQNQEINTLDDSISKSEAEIANLEMKIAELQNSITEKTKELEQKQKEYDKNKALMENRLVVMYETGEMTFLDMLFSSENIIEFISNYYMLSQITECDKELLDSLEKEKQEIEETKKTLEDEKTQVNSAKIEKETKANQLKTQKAQRQEKVNSLTDTQKALQSEIDNYKKKMEAIDEAINEAIRKAMEEENKNNGGTSGNTGSKFDGTFTWPLDYSPRRVTSRMKIRWGRWHKGIDIGTNAEIGKTVVAAASGTVIYSAYQSGTSSNPGYGNYLIIYHGNGFASLYAHMQSKSVGSGAYVTKGQTIGYSGNTGGVAPHLHFEIRKASSVGNFFGVNNWLDPLDYLPGGYTIVD